MRAILAVFLLSGSLSTLAMAQSADTTTTAPATPPAATTTAPATTTPPATTPPAAGTTDQGTTPPATADQPPPAPGDSTVDPNADPNADPSAADGSGDDVSVGDIPDVTVVELKPDTSRKALDAYVLVRDKYKDEQLEDYESLQDFVDKSPKGKAFEADIKAAGFASMDEWNNIITNLSFAYANMVEDQTADLNQQIDEIKNDNTMAQDMKDRMVKAIAAMIPSENNKKVVEEISKDPAYTDKLKMLETENETE